MGRPRGPNRDKAWKIYKRHEGKIKNKEIAELLGEDPKTVSKWKKLDRWEKKLSNSKKNSDDSTYEKSLEECGIREEEIVNIEEADELNEKQLLFCIYYTKCFNATKAYQRAYECKKTTAMVEGCKILKKDNIRKTIEELKQGIMNRAMLKTEDVYQKYIDIAFADITDYVKFGQRMEVVDEKQVGDTTVDVWKKVNYANIKESEEIDGTLLKEIRVGPKGISVKLEDRMKALDWLADHMYMATPEQIARVESLTNKVRTENERLELEKKRFERDEF